MSSKPHKRSRRATDKSRARCPFSVTLLPTAVSDDDYKAKKQRRDEPEGGTNPKLQEAPFAPAGKVKSVRSMDVYYDVEPRKRWLSMTRYNSFVLNGTKYLTEDYVYVTNEATIERQKAAVEPVSPGTVKKSNDYWVARILEIRATDELHVYARVFWMYSPDELPFNTIDGRRTIAGRQPYHGQHELIASNHMDIINVVSVAMPATVNHWIEADEEVQDALYWRQAFDYRTAQLSSVERTCRCGMPANPDQTLIGCVNDSCGKWMHYNCLLHDVLTRTFEALGKDKPHKKALTLTKEEKDENHALHTVSPLKCKGENQSTIAMEDGSNIDNMMMKPPVDREVPMTPRSNTPTPGPTSGNLGSKSPIKKRGTRLLPSSKPYSGLFDAVLKIDEGPTMWFVKDLREIIEGGGDQTWTESAQCLLCGSTID